MGVQSIWEATMCECPDELKEQADDMDEIMRKCALYMHNHGVTLENMIMDIREVLQN